MNPQILYVVPIVGIVGMLFAVMNFVWVRKYSPGNEKMCSIADKIHLGAMVFLKREYSIIAIFMIIVFIVLSIALRNVWTGVAYLSGALCSMFAGYFGMEAATRSGPRTCHAAKEGGAPKALMVAFLGGSVMGLSVASLGIIGLGIFFIATMKDTQSAPVIISGFAMGASSIALFARVGGGIYTKSADVGADLVGKVEAGIPEDDPRNPGVIADNVGDNVGDTAGMGADLFESYVGSVVATMAIAATLTTEVFAHMSLPLILIVLGLLSSLVGIYSIGILKKIDPQSALRYSTYIAGLLFIVAAFFATRFLTGGIEKWWAILVGMATGVLIGIESEYFTSGPSIQRLGKIAESGPAPIIISGIALGYRSAILPVITIAAATYIAFTFGGGLYGVAISAVGMLSTIGIVMSTDSYGPIADNAGGIAEMSGAGPEVRKVTDRLDALGNTTAAIGKGFAIGSAALTALALFSAYQKTVGLNVIDLTNTMTVIGLFLGAMMPFLIASLTMEAVSKAANQMVLEIRRQFREITGLLEGKAEPQIDKCIDIVTRGSLREMIVPGVLALVAPVAVGFILGPESLGGFLAGATATGVLLGISMANGGGAWDNAKKWIEEGNLGGKGSESHKAAVVGDTVGDPFKDTSGPSMNILIKLMAVVSLVFAPLFARLLQ